MSGVRSSAGGELHFRSPKTPFLFGRESEDWEGQEGDRQRSHIRTSTDVRIQQRGWSNSARVL
jgi:hypothetical protein